MAYIWLICLWRISLTISHLGRISLLYPTLGGYPCCIPPGADIPAASHLGRISLTVSHLWRISVNVSHLWRISLTVSHLWRISLTVSLLRWISLTVSWRKPIHTVGARVGVSTQMITNGIYLADLPVADIPDYFSPGADIPAVSHLGRISLLYPTWGGYPCCIPPGADISDCISPVADIRECISPVADIPDCISPVADIPDCILEEAYRCQDWYIHPNDHLQQYYQSSCGVSNGVCTVLYSMYSRICTFNL